MKEFLQKRWVRVLALVLLVVLLVGILFVSGIVRYGWKNSWYGLQGVDIDSFADTLECQNYVYSGLYYVYDNVTWLNDLTREDLGSYAGDAFSYVIRDANENITADTRTPNSVPVSSLFADSFSVQGYVNLPVEKYEGCYAEYAVFEMFFGLRYLLLALMIVLSLLALALLAGAAFSYYCRGKDGKLSRFQQLPVDGTAVVCAAAAAALNPNWREYFGRLGFYIYSEQAYYILETLLGNMRLVPWFLAAVLLVCLTVGQLGSRIFYQKLLVRRANGVMLVIGVFAVHFVLLYLLYMYGRRWWVIVYDLFMLAVVLWTSVEAGMIKKSFQALSGGDLAYKTRTNKLHFIWRTLGEGLNSIGDGMTQALDEKMRSERMKTELITNVGHDIKTPLTSIINYVDLLKNGDLDEETRREYLEILDKQSAKLKKLTEDVIEASKSASGALPVSKEPIDAVEILEQFLAEYEGRLADAKITPVFSAPEEECTLLADSVLLGRVLDNLFSNAVKYAQPDTRLYIDLAKAEGSVKLTMKNTSHEPLNISVDELMERFVRGDRSRHTDGSGLGLSIARSLTELMGGKLGLTLDGDLFKAEIELACP